MESYKKELVIQATPGKIFETISTEEGLAGWWTSCESDWSRGFGEVGQCVTLHFDEDFTVMEIEKSDVNRELVWKCVEHHFGIPGAPTDEWVGTHVRFVLQPKDRGTLLSFEHKGLVPTLACYKACREGWDYYLESLKKYMETGEGTPYRGANAN